MRSMLLVIVGLIGGFILGIALSSCIGVFSYYVLEEPFGIKFLPYFTSIIGGIVIPIIDKKNKK